MVNFSCTKHGPYKRAALCFEAPTEMQLNSSHPHPKKKEDADASEPDGRVPGPDRLDVREDADPRVDEASTRNLQVKE